EKRAVPPPADREELVRTFAIEWAKENHAQPVLDKLPPLVERHPKWFSRDELGRMVSAKGREGCNLFMGLMADDLYDEQLEKCGLGLSTEGATARKRLAPRFNAVFLYMGGASGKLRGAKPAGDNRLSPVDEKKLQQKLTADLKCRFSFAAN